ncbi:MAG: heme lyase CcmF/NrfE family subunit [Alphaproteobacteria bacterium]|nr:heme lyase CcmF/NrfE family subunit [Alphaproteobacteria bacterium]
MIPELGHYCLILALVISGVQVFVRHPYVRINAAYLGFLLTLGAFGALVYSYATSDFTLQNVANNSHSLKPMIYKITGTWGNHEGSMLLWALILALFSVLLARHKDMPLFLKSTALAVQGSLSLGFLGFIIFASNPFLRLNFPPLDGAGMNPILQDIGLAMHPPLLYAGYVGFSAVFSLAVSALIHGKMNSNWARCTKPYLLAAWTSLSAGIALGSWWAYYELGWGGWWFWDPVENASLMPWLMGTALLHSIIVLEKRETLQKWVALLAILTFSLSMLGTFLVRSGVLTSVHSFASDPFRGIIILGLISFFTGGALLLYAMRAHKIGLAPVNYSTVSRESALILNNLFMVTACATVLIGTLYPLIMEALNAGQIAVGPPYFAATFVPLALPALILMGAAPYLAWKRGNIRTLWPRLQSALIITLIGAGLILINSQDRDFTTILILGIALWLGASTLHEWFLATGKLDLDRIFTLPLTHQGMSLSHLGMAVALIGMVGSSLWVQEDIRVMKPGERADIGRYTLSLKTIEKTFGENYMADTAHIELTHFGASIPIATLAPERRYYPVSQQTTTEAAIRTSLQDDIYIAFNRDESDPNAKGWVIRTYIHPMIAFLWSGFMMIAIGGVLCLLAPKARNFMRGEKNAVEVTKL